MSEDKISPEKFERLMKAHESGDEEVAHAGMDELMCQVLRDLGYGSGVDVFDRQEKWYA